MGERHEWARKKQGWALTADIAEQAKQFDWDGDWPEVDTDGYLTGGVVAPGGGDKWTVVDVIQPPAGPPDCRRHCWPSSQQQRTTQRNGQVVFAGC